MLSVLDKSIDEKNKGLSRDDGIINPKKKQKNKAKQKHPPAKKKKKKKKSRKLEQMQ